MPEYVTVAAFERVARELMAANVRYLVVGGLAVQAHGFDRATYDVDLVIQLAAGNVENAFNALDRATYKPLVPINSRQFSDPLTRAGLIRDKGMTVLNFWSEQFPATRLDIFVTEPFDFDAEYEAALLDHSLPGITLRFPRAETLLAMKRLAGRPKDQHDILYLESLLNR